MFIITTENQSRWNEIVKSFPNWDIYYLYEYAKSLELHGDGKPYLIYYEKENKRICYVVMQKDIAECHSLANYIKKDIWFDWETPYGYGGPLEDGNIEKGFIESFIKEITEYGKEHHIVAQFLRFHPLLNNYRHWEGACQIHYLKQTIFIDTAQEELVMKNMDTKNRNMIRKAIKNEVIIEAEDNENIDEFISIYKKTMRKNKASDYYYFDKEYFTYIFNNMKENIKLFCAYYKGNIISSAIFFYNDDYMHYHLSGTLEEYKTLASNNLLLYEAALWASRHGIRSLHLGGGVESEDGLFHFKKQFNKIGNLDFFVGRTIFDMEQYNVLMDIRKKTDENFKVNNSFMIQYRYEL